MKRPVRITSALFVASALGCGTGQWAWAQGVEAPAALSESQVKTPGPAIVETSVPVVPGAEEVVVDVPNAMAWSRYQRGTSGEWMYHLYPDGSGTVRRTGERQSAYEFVCTENQSCDVTGRDGTRLKVAAGATSEGPSDDGSGQDLAQHLAVWVLSNGSPAPAETQEDASELLADVEDATVIAEEQPALKAETDALPAATAPKPETSNSAATVVEADSQAPVETQVALAPSKPAPNAQSAPVAAKAVTPRKTAPKPPKAKRVQRAAPKKRTAPKPSTTQRITRPLALPAAPRKETAPKKPRLSFGKGLGLSCYATTAVSLQNTDREGETTSFGKPRITLGCSGKLHEKLSYNIALREYFFPDEQRPWDPDFTYAFTYRPTKNITLTYANYGARFDGPNGEGTFWDSLLWGNIRASYKLPSVNLWNDQKLSCSTSIGLPRIKDKSVNLSCSAGITKKLRVGGTLLFYFPDEQGTYNPDYTYTASYKFNDRFSLNYSNYSNNRWSWNRGEDPGPGFLGGSLSLTYRFKF